MIFLRHETTSLWHIVAARQTSSAHSSLRSPTHGVTRQALHGRVRLYTVCTDQRATHAGWPATVGGDSACFAGAGSRAPTQTPDKRPLSAGGRRVRLATGTENQLRHRVRESHTSRAHRVSPARIVLPAGFCGARLQGGRAMSRRNDHLPPQVSRRYGWSLAVRAPSVTSTAYPLFSAVSMTMVTRDHWLKRQGAAAQT